jgi:hypothetical protein
MPRRVSHRFLRLIIAPKTGAVRAAQIFRLIGTLVNGDGFVKLHQFNRKGIFFFGLADEGPFRRSWIALGFGDLFSATRAHARAVGKPHFPLRRHSEQPSRRDRA